MIPWQKRDKNPAYLELKLLKKMVTHFNTEYG